MTEQQLTQEAPNIVDHISMVFAAGLGATLNMIITWLVLDVVIFRNISVPRSISGADHPDGITNIGVSLVVGLVLLGVGLGSFILAAFLPGWVLQV